MASLRGLCLRRVSGANTIFCHLLLFACGPSRRLGCGVLASACPSSQSTLAPVIPPAHTRQRAGSGTRGHLHCVPVGPAGGLHRLNRQTAHSSRFLSDGHAGRVSLPARPRRGNPLRSLRYLLFKSPPQPGRLFSISALVGYFRTKWSRRSIASIGLCPARPRRMTLILCSCSSGKSSSSRRVPERKMSTAG